MHNHIMNTRHHNSAPAPLFLLYTTKELHKNYTYKVVVIIIIEQRTIINSAPCMIILIIYTKKKELHNNYIYK